MKLPTPFIIVTTFILVALGLTTLPVYREKVRPIKVLVIDDFNDEPVKNAVVYYSIKTVRMKNLLGIPIIDPLTYRRIAIRRLVTDENGYIFIPQSTVSLKLYEKVYREYIYINLELINKTGKAGDFFKGPKGNKCNPINYLKGAIIDSSKVYLNPDDYRLDSEGEIFEYILNGKSLIKEADELIIRLRRHETSN